MTALAAPVVLPFTLRLGHVLLDARINGRPATLALDTGSGACAIDAEWGNEQQLVGEREVKAVGVDDLGVRLTTLESLDLGNGVELRNQLGALVPLRNVSARHGRRIHGTVGFPIFSKHIVEIDYAARVVRLHDAQSFVYDGHGEKISIDLSMRVPVLNAELLGRGGEPLPARLLLDIGTAGYGAILTKPFVDRHSAILNEPPFIEGQIGAGVGGTARGRITMVSALRIGKLTVKNPVVALPSNARGFFGVDWVEGTLGAAILRRTRLILDYSHSQVIIEPVDSLDARFDYDLSGLSFRAAGSGFESVVIDDVIPDSAADVATLKAGDVVRWVDRRTVSGDSLEWLVEQLAVPGAAYTVCIERGGQVVELELKLGVGEILGGR